MHPASRRRRGLTLIDVLIVFVVLVILVGGALPNVVSRSSESAHRVKCAATLRTIGLATLLYANANGGALPRTSFDPTQPPTAFTGASAPDPFAPGGPAANDVTASMYLLLRTQDFTPDSFVCSNAWQQAMRYPNGTKATSFSNFTSPGELSYSYANLYMANPPTTAANDPIDPTRFALAADLNPGTPQLLTITPTSPANVRRLGNSFNHDQDGQNVLYLDGHVDWYITPLVGIAQDNIYTYGPSGIRPGATTGGTGIVGAPVDREDSVLLPVTPGRRPPTVAGAVGRLWPRGLIAIGVAGMLLFLIIIVFRRPRMAASATSSEARRDVVERPG